MKTRATPYLQLLVRLPRLSGWAFISLLLAFAVLFIAPQQLPVSLYKLSLVTLAGVIGYRLDRSMFPYARPDMYLAPLTVIDETPSQEVFERDIEKWMALENQRKRPANPS